MPDLIDTPSGCSFRPRCPHATQECSEIEPPLESVSNSDKHASACFHVDSIDFKSALDIEAQPEAVDRTIGDEILKVSGLQKFFKAESQSWIDAVRNGRKFVHAVDDVSLSIRRGETLGLVGESGCGKTTLGRTITQLYEPDDGTVLFVGKELTKMGHQELKESRSELQMIFQDPFSSLNPRRTVKGIIGRPLEIHNPELSADEREERIRELLDQVGLEEGHLNRYPHEFSGGQKQRIGIARALAVEPDFIVADEPVSALDVSVQAKITNLLMDLQEEYDLTYLFIAHDLNVVQHISDRIGVMYLGEIVEIGTTDEIFEPPYHPYTELLLSSIPRPDPAENTNRSTNSGKMPNPSDPPSGCRFHDRCTYAMPECKSENPASHEIDDGHEIDCHLFDSEISERNDVSLKDIKEIQRESVHQRGTQLSETK